MNRTTTTAGISVSEENSYFTTGFQRLVMEDGWLFFWAYIERVNDFISSEHTKYNTTGTLTIMAVKELL